jgi:hypothetical protein
VRITELEFERLCSGLREDRELIIKHNPIGSDEEILLWMLLSVLISYLSLSDIETPCFTGKATEETYREAIRFILNERRENDFDPEPALDRMLK